MFPEIPDDLSGIVEPVQDQVDLTPILTRRLAWDSLPCDEAPAVLERLGLTPSSPEGAEIEHQDSHQRIMQVMPLEPFLQRSASVLGTVVSMAMAEAKGVADQLVDEDGMEHFAAQNAEVALCSARAIIAQLMDEGVIMYTPEALLAVAM